MLRSTKIILFSFLLPVMLCAQDIIDGVAAIVADKIILKSDVFQMAQMTAIQNQIDFSKNPQAAANFRASALEGLIIKNLLIARAKVDSLDDVDEAQVDARLDQQIDNMMAQLGSEEAFKEALGQSVRDFRIEQWFSTKDDIVAQQYRTEKIKHVKISRSEVIDFYATYKDSIPAIEPRYEISNLVIPIVAGDDAKETAHKRVLQIQQLLKEGADFGQVARDFSDDPGSSARDGDLGFVQRGQFVLEFEEMAFSMEIGTVSDIVESVFGFHIIHLIDRVGEKIHARHILISPKPSEADREFVLKKIREYYFTLVEDPLLFDTLVTEIKVENENIRDLGYIGWLEYSQLPGDGFKSAVFGSKAGTITPPFESPQGFHILHVVNFKDGGKPNLEEFYPQVESLALRFKQNKYFKNWITTIRNSVFIKHFE